jgi:hypothetical protein
MHDLKVWPNVEADGSEPTKTPGRTSSTLSEDQMSRLAKVTKRLETSRTLWMMSVVAYHDIMNCEIFLKFKFNFLVRVLLRSNSHTVKSTLFFFFFFYGTGVWTQSFMLAKQALYCLSHTSSPFCSGYFGDGVLRTVCPGWPWTMILSISASKVVIITGVNHWHPDP